MDKVCEVGLIGYLQRIVIYSDHFDPKYLLNNYYIHTLNDMSFLVNHVAIIVIINASTTTTRKRRKDSKICKIIHPNNNEGDFERQFQKNVSS